MDYNLVILVTSILSAVLVALDWLIGTAHRKTIKEKVGWWFLILEDKTWAGLVSTDARFLKKALQFLFGKKIISLYFPIRVFLFWLVILVAIVILQGLGSVDIAKAEEIFPKSGDLGVEMLEKTIWTYLFLMLIHTFPYILASLGLTYYLFRLMSEKIRSAKYLSALIAIDVITSILLAIASLVGVISYFANDQLFEIINTNMLEFGMENSEMITLGIMEILVDKHIDFLLDMSFYIACGFSLLHLFYALLVLISKPLTKWVKTPIIIILHRFYESEKGVLTQLAAVFAGVSFMIVSFTKYLASTGAQ